MILSLYCCCCYKYTPIAYAPVREKQKEKKSWDGIPNDGYETKEDSLANFLDVGGKCSVIVFVRGLRFGGKLMIGWRLVDYE